MKVVSLFVIGIHAFILLWMALWMPVKLIEKKPLIVRTVTEIAQKPAAKAVSPQIETVKQEIKAPPIPVLKKASPKTPSLPSPKTVGSKPISPVIPQSLIKELQESLAKIEGKSHNPTGHKQAAAHKSLKLQIDDEEGRKEGNYAGDLIHFLQSMLELPDMGMVKVELTLKQDGAFLKIRYLESASDQNRKFLENELRRLKYPPFSGPLKQQQEHSFVITFCNH